MLMWLTSRERGTLWALSVSAALALAVHGYRQHQQRVDVRVVPADVAAWDAALTAARTCRLNTATPADLERLPGIGPTLATRIVTFRDTHGPFRSVDELARVAGIGPTLLHRLREYLSL